MTLFLTVIIAIIVEKHISGFFKKPQMEHFMVPKVEQIRQPAPKRDIEKETKKWMRWHNRSTWMWTKVKR